jgi:hypothetical protein
MLRCYRRSGLLVLAAILSGCKAKEAPVVETKGECADVFQGQVCTWVRTRGTTVVEAGATVPVASIENAPKEQAMAWPPAPVATLRLPQSADPHTGLTELTMYWEATGHPPRPYLVPHFDFHFYTVAPEEQAAIDCTDATKPSVLPAGYAMPDLDLPPPMAKMTGTSTLVGLCVPHMGMHALSAAELQDTIPFRGTMIVGYYHGKPAFVEPMLTSALLMEKRGFDLAIPSIPGMTGVYPRTFRADYDAEKQVYHFVFAGFAPGT